MAQNYSLLIESADNIVWDSGHLHRNPKVYVTISLDNNPVSRTPVFKRSLQPKWNFNVNLTFIPHRADPFLGKCQIGITELLDQCNSGQVVQLDVATSGEVCGRLTVLLERSEEAATHATQRMKKTAGILSSGGSGFDTVETTVKVAVVDNDLATALNTCLNRLDVFVKMGDKLAQAVKQQHEMDNQVVDLVKTMVEVYSFEEEINFVPEKIRILEESLLKISQHTLDCANFLEEYKQHGFAVCNPLTMDQGEPFKPHF
ncbi:hypothetical protein B0H16DRAFT_1482660 [Mycena metata]|uniref:C2 domain-containing protein n=1 Tax=Mycena metata TaxID=1033252 RepID=A0AAD7M753_9AGAR|nr:hypothetical protein B0H16DRAFT_1482660 [Mycena metata]